jgi:hypothetical protein
VSKANRFLTGAFQYSDTTKAGQGRSESPGERRLNEGERGQRETRKGNGKGQRPKAKAKGQRPKAEGAKRYFNVPGIIPRLM